jgi:uncharacterized protein DUF4326
MNKIMIPFDELKQIVKSGLTANGLQLPADLTKTQWSEIGLGLGKVGQSTQWWIGDWWAFGEHKWGDRKALVESEAWEGPALQTCMNAASICRAFETSRRREVLSFMHHAEVAAIPPEEADKILDWAENKGKSRTVREVRDEVKRVKAYLAQGWTTSQLERKAEAEKGKAVLANMVPDDKGLPTDNALIAWAESLDLAARIDRQSIWGNPYEVDADGTRKEVIEWYREYFAHKRSLHKRLPELAEKKVLLCWCYPKPCHGHFLLEQISK